MMRKHYVEINYPQRGLVLQPWKDGSLQSKESEVWDVVVIHTIWTTSKKPLKKDQDFATKLKLFNSINPVMLMSWDVYCQICRVSRFKSGQVVRIKQMWRSCWLRNCLQKRSLNLYLMRRQKLLKNIFHHWINFRIVFDFEEKEDLTDKGVDDYSLCKGLEFEYVSSRIGGKFISLFNESGIKTRIRRGTQTFLCWYYPSKANIDHHSCCYPIPFRLTTVLWA